MYFPFYLFLVLDSIFTTKSIVNSIDYIQDCTVLISEGVGSICLITLVNPCRGPLEEKNSNPVCGFKEISPTKRVRGRDKAIEGA